ncbi:hypothetical protein EH222_03185 [candidate division KSB1 bacterium]|nr:MAG: hypothetical protein EH222_03185 [candidate division KSB1 bacterium]
MTVRQDIGEFKGGSCRVADKHLVILRKTDPDMQKIDILTRELAAAPFDGIEIDSAVRHYLEQCKEKYGSPV